jgi:peptidoglycan/LPS O-acetylase OafA/YrhL
MSIALAYLFCWRSGQYVNEFPFLKSSDWLWNLTMLQGFVGRPHVWGVFWTLQLELTIYAACSLLYGCGLLNRTGRIAALALVGYLAFGLARPLCSGKLFQVNGFRLLYFAPLAGLLAQRWFSGAIPGRSLAGWIVAFLGALVGVWGVNHALFPELCTTVALGQMACTWGLAFACFFGLMAMKNRSMPWPLGWIGKTSYSAYLTHTCLLGIVGGYALPAWGSLSLMLATTLALAGLWHRWIEQPGIALGRLIERRLWPPAASPRETSPLKRAA